MTSRFHKLVYAAMAFGLATACAGGPNEAELAQRAAADGQARRLASEYAHVVRDQGQAVARYGLAHPKRAQLVAQRSRLRSEITVTGAEDIRIIVADALAKELGDAKADRARVLSRYRSDNPNVIEAEQEVVALEAALAEETGRGASAG